MKSFRTADYIFRPNHIALELRRLGAISAVPMIREPAIECDGRHIKPRPEVAANV